MSFFLTQLFVSFVTIFLRGVQTQNVVNGDYKGAAFTSTMMSVCNVAFISLIAQNTWDSLIPVAIGSAAGVVLSMYIKRKDK